MSQPGTPSRIVLASLWLLVGAAMLAVPIWVGWTRWPVLLNGHPALLATTIGTAMIGVVAVAWALASLIRGGRFDEFGDPDHPQHRTKTQLQRRARWRISLAVPTLLICLVLVAVTAWSRPFAASAEAVAAARTSDTVRIADRLTWFEMTGIRKDQNGQEIKPTVGLVFSPGARVDSRAYARLLTPLARAGYLVIILKEPFGIALADPGHATRAIEVHPKVRYWAVGGHSLGGTAAAAFADAHPQVKGLVLYASYPAGKLARTDLKVTSISGTADQLATPADIADSKANLPAGTKFVPIRGAVHAYFGDYGEQPGDGTPSIERAAAQAQIAKTTQALMASLVPPPPKKKK